MLQTSPDQPEVPKRLGGATGRGWMPGQSGNPKGRSEEVKVNGKTLPELARSMTHDELHAVQRMRAEAERVMTDADTPMPQRLQAGELARQCSDTILRRGWGDAPRVPDLGTEGLTVIVQTLDVVPQPVRGVLASPVQENVWREPLTLDAPTSEVSS